MLPLVLFSLIVLLCIFFAILVKQKSFSIGIFLLVLYAGSIALTPFINNNNKIFSYKATTYFLLNLILYLYPAFKFKPMFVVPLGKRNESLFVWISYFFISSGLLSYIYFVPVILRIFMRGESFLILRTSLVGGDRYLSVAENPILLFLNFSNQFYPIILLFYVFSINFLNKKPLFNRLLLVSSTGYTLNVLTAVGRDGVVLWLMSFGFCLLMLKDFFFRKKKKRIFRNFLILGSLGFVFLIPITISRFFYLGPRAGIESILSYSGQQFGNFNNFYNRISELNKSAEMPEKKKFSVWTLKGRGRKYSENSFLEIREERMQIFGFDPNVFATFVGSLLLYFNKFKTLLLICLISGFGILIFAGSKSLTFSKMLLVVLYCQIPLHGIFYFKLNYTVSYLYIISTLLISFLFYANQSKDEVYVPRWSRKSKIGCTHY